MSNQKKSNATVALPITITAATALALAGIMLGFKGISSCSSRSRHQRQSIGTSSYNTAGNTADNTSGNTSRIPSYNTSDNTSDNTSGNTSGNTSRIPLNTTIQAHSSRILAPLGNSQRTTLSTGQNSSLLFTEKGKCVNLLNKLEGIDVTNYTPAQAREDLKTLYQRLNLPNRLERTSADPNDVMDTTVTVLGEFYRYPAYAVPCYGYIFDQGISVYNHGGTFASLDEYTQNIILQIIRFITTKLNLKNTDEKDLAALVVGLFNTHNGHCSARLRALTEVAKTTILKYLQEKNDLGYEITDDIENIMERNISAFKRNISQTFMTRTLAGFASAEHHNERIMDTKEIQTATNKTLYITNSWDSYGNQYVTEYRSSLYRSSLRNFLKPDNILGILKAHFMDKANIASELEISLSDCGTNFQLFCRLIKKDEETVRDKILELYNENQDDEYYLNLYNFSQNSPDTNLYQVLELISSELFGDDVFKVAAEYPCPVFFLYCAISQGYMTLG